MIFSQFCYACFQPEGTKDFVAKLQWLFGKERTETTDGGERNFARVLQYLCITVLYQIVGSQFVRMLLDMEKYIGKQIANYDKINQTPKCLKKWKNLLLYYESAVAGVWSFATGQWREYQDALGYRLYSKYWLLFFPPQTAITASRMKKRKGIEEDFRDKVCLAKK